jgi:hypothetical protein
LLHPPQWQAGFAPSRETAFNLSRLDASLAQPLDCPSADRLALLAIDYDWAIERQHPAPGTDIG